MKEKRILVAYATNAGSTENIARIVAEELSATGEPVDILVNSTLIARGEVVLRVVEPDAVPALGDLRPGDAETQPEAAAGQVVERRRLHANVRDERGRALRRHLDRARRLYEQVLAMEETALQEPSEG